MRSERHRRFSPVLLPVIALILCTCLVAFGQREGRPGSAPEAPTPPAQAETPPARPERPAPAADPATERPAEPERPARVPAPDEEQPPPPAERTPEAVEDEFVEDTDLPAPAPGEVEAEVEAEEPTVIEEPTAMPVPLAAPEPRPAPRAVTDDTEATAAAARDQARERRTEAITQSIERLSAEDADEMSTSQIAALIAQVTQGARVELGALREETAQARLTLERVEEIEHQISRDRAVVPRQVRTGQIPALGARNRWDALQQTNLELQEIIDRAFSERLRLLSEIPKAEEALDEVGSLRARAPGLFDESLQQVLEDAEGYLSQRLDAMQELLDVYNEQAAIATDAYDESSRYTEELSAAIVAARHRGLLARTDERISLETLSAIACSLAELPRLGDAIVTGYYEDDGRPAQTMLGYALRLAGSVVLLAGLVLLWIRLPVWLTTAVARRTAEAPRPDTDGGEDLRELRMRRYAELLTPVARAAVLAVVAALALVLWGLPQEWINATLAVLGTWAGYFAFVAVMRQLLAPRHEDLRIIHIGSDSAAALFRLLRGLALWTAIIMPVIWVLSLLDYPHGDVLVLLSVIHVVGLAIIAEWLIYGAGGPEEFVADAEDGAEPLRIAVTIGVPVILGLIAAIAILKAIGYVNLGGYLGRALALELPLVVVALILDWQIRVQLASGSLWRWRLRTILWTAFGLAQIWVFDLRFHHFVAVLELLRRPLFTVAEAEVSVLSIFRAIIVIFVSWVVARVLRRWLTRSRTISARLSEGVQYALSSLTFYLILVAGILWAMLVGGFPLNALTVLAGMAGIGLGFGLQDIVRNFVAGMILLIERPLAVGDYIEVAGTWGRVSSISLRSTVVRTQQNVHILVPNGDIISEQLTNLSHHDLSLRVDVNVGVSYDADIDRVCEILVQVARDHEDVSDFPESSARLVNFGDNSIDMQLMVWVRDPAIHKRTEVELNLDIWRTLKREGIEIPFPQRDIHIRSAEVPLSIETFAAPPHRQDAPQEAGDE